MKIRFTLSGVFICGMDVTVEPHISKYFGASQTIKGSEYKN